MVHLTTACSGADSILAILILLPVMLVVFEASPARKITIVVVGSLLAVVANNVRILAIIAALHYFGMTFALKILHPILGAILFFAMIALLLIIGGRKLLVTTAVAGMALQRPRWWRLTFVIAIAVVMTAWPS
jgi:exosortase/archaeosortase family protein